MTNTANKINGEWWEMREVKLPILTQYVLVNTHQKEEYVKGTTQLTEEKTFLNKIEALYFLNDIDNSLREVILNLSDGDSVLVRLKGQNSEKHSSGRVTNNKDCLTIVSKGNDSTFLYSQIENLEKIS